MSLDLDALLKSLHSGRLVSGLTHGYYHYPARFAPEFVREVIDLFTRPGEAVLDPFMGGGTTIVEAVASGRLAIGADVNQLAHFITRVKTTPLSKQDYSDVLSWAMQPSSSPRELASAGQLPAIRNLPDRLQPFFASALGSITMLRFPRQRRFARCALLRIGQWALDCQSDELSEDQLHQELHTRVRQMLTGLEEFVVVSKQQGVKKYDITGQRHFSLLLSGRSATIPPPRVNECPAKARLDLPSKSRSPHALSSLASGWEKRNTCSLLDRRSAGWSRSLLLYDGQPNPIRPKKLLFHTVPRIFEP